MTHPVHNNVGWQLQWQSGTGTSTLSLSPPPLPLSLSPSPASAWPAGSSTLSLRQMRGWGQTCRDGGREKDSRPEADLLLRHSAVVFITQHSSPTTNNRHQHITHSLTQSQSLLMNVYDYADAHIHSVHSLVMCSKVLRSVQRTG